MAASSPTSSARSLNAKQALTGADASPGNTDRRGVDKPSAPVQVSFMNSLLRRALPFALLGLLLSVALPQSARAAGTSVAFLEDAEPFFKNDPALLDYIHKTLDYEPIGWSKDPSRSFNNPVGERVLPYGFRAKPKGVPGNYTVLLLIEQNSAGDGVILTITPLKPHPKTDAIPTPAPAQP